ncbi:MAG: hypothetical protein COA94_05625 [Rickettsiales bacterium]|nr:MAG: hypothetical protein COA94_05625 [Rickettsiales bacterium]
MKELIAKFDDFEERFAKDTSDPELIKFFDEFVGYVEKIDLDSEKHLQIKQRMHKLQQLFASRKEELTEESNNLMVKQKQFNRYITNFGYKNFSYKDGLTNKKSGAKWN